MEDKELDLFGTLRDKDSTPLRKRTKLGNTDIEVNSGFGDSSYDKEFFPDAEINDEEGLDLFESINENRATRQPWLAKAGAGVGRAATKAGLEIAKMVPTVGGIIGGLAGNTADLLTGEDNTDFLETAFNNSWIKKIDAIGEDINTELLPVYVKKAVKDGNLWDNFSSIDFWATEGADGIGYMAAMLAPGALINKFGTGAKVFKGLNKLGTMSSKLDDAAIGLGKLGITPGSVDVTSAALANTLFEAGAEARGAGDSYIAKMTPKLERGEISQEDFDLGKAEVMRNNFITNMTVLAGPNLMMSKMLWGKGAKKAVGKLTNAEGALLKEMPKKTLKGSVGRGTKDLGKGALSEGFFEEGMQSVSENYFVDKAVDGESVNIFDLVGDLPGSYIDMISTTEGQKAVMLGGILGGGMTTVGGKIQRNGEGKAIAKLLPELHKLDSFYKVFADDIHTAEGEIDPIKFKEKADALGISEQLSEAYDVAIQSGDENAIEAIRAHTSGELIKNFIFNDELGIDALSQYLESSKTIEEVAQKEQKDVETISKSILGRAKKLQQDYNTFKDFAPSLIELENENSTKEDQVRYYDNLASRYITNKNLKYFYEDQLNSTKEQRAGLLKSLDMQENLVTEDETLVKAEKDNFALKEVNDEIRGFEKSLTQLKQNDNNFWKKENHQKAFNADVKTREVYDKAMSEQKQKQIEDIQATISTATTEAELDDIKYTGTVADKALKVAVKNKRSEIQKETARSHKEKADEQTTTTEEVASTEEVEIQTAEEEVQSIPNTYNVGEDFTISQGLIKASNGVLTQDDLDVSARVLNTGDITDTSVKITLDNGKVITLPKTITREEESNPNQEFNTEGSVNHDLLIPKTNENKETGSDAAHGNGSQVISYDNNKKKKFDFVSDEYVTVEQEPTNKIGVNVNFTINKSPGSNSNLNNALKGYDKLLRGGKLIQAHIEFLIKYLPINIILGDSEAPIHTAYKSKGNLDKFNKSTRILRTKIVNALMAGVDIKDIVGTIEGQAGGALQVDPNINNLAPENGIKELHFATKIENKKLTSEIRKRIGFINQNGELEYLDGKINPTFKGVKGIGEVYMNIPKANGKNFPLKLNIKRIGQQDADLLAKLYKIRIEDKSINKSTTLEEIEDVEFKAEVKKLFKKQIGIIGKSFKDATVKDIVDFMIWDASSSLKTRVGFTGTGEKGVSHFNYGIPGLDGMTVTKPEEFDETHFSEWLQNNKRHNINLKPKKNATTKATIATNNEYLDYLLDSKILNTNAKVGENTPTFQGYTAIFLDSNDIKYPEVEKAVETVTLDTTPYNKDKDGDGTVITVGGKAYLVSGKSGRLFATTKKVDTNKAIPPAATFTGEVITDNVIIEAVEKAADAIFMGMMEFNLKRSENKSEIIRNSKKNNVSLQEIPNTVENKKVTEMIKKDESVDTPNNITEELIESIIEEVMDLGLLQDGSETFNNILDASTNEAKFNGLKTLVEKANLDINDIITKCN